MSGGLRERLAREAETVIGLGDWKADPECGLCRRPQAQICPIHAAQGIAQALLPVVEREIAAARGEALREAADNMPISRPGQSYEHAAGWLHRRANLLDRAALSPDPDRGEGEGA